MSSNFCLQRNQLKHQHQQVSSEVFWHLWSVVWSLRLNFSFVLHIALYIIIHKSKAIIKCMHLCKQFETSADYTFRNALLSIHSDHAYLHIVELGRTSKISRRHWGTIPYSPDVLTSQFQKLSRNNSLENNEPRCHYSRLWFPLKPKRLNYF